MSSSGKFSFTRSSTVISFDRWQLHAITSRNNSRSHPTTSSAMASAARLLRCNQCSHPTRVLDEVHGSFSCPGLSSFYHRHNKQEGPKHGSCAPVQRQSSLKTFSKVQCLSREKLRLERLLWSPSDAICARKASSPSGSRHRHQRRVIEVPCRLVPDSESWPREISMTMSTACVTSIHQLPDYPPTCQLFATSTQRTQRPAVPLQEQQQP